MATATKKIIKLSDLANIKRPLDVSDEHQVMIRALTLREMVTLFLESQDAFLPLFAAGLDGKFEVKELMPFLLTSPTLVAKIIALASDEPDASQSVETSMPATVQLIALSEIWRASIPDPKKARELLSEVTALLQKAYETGQKEIAKGQPPTPSPIILPRASNS